MSKVNRVRIVSGLMLLGLAALAAAQTEIDWQSIDGGGGVSAGADIELIGVIGQSDTARMTGGDLSLSAGYLPLSANPESIFKDSFE